jgi:hypothetical protein
MAVRLRSVVGNASRGADPDQTLVGEAQLLAGAPAECIKRPMGRQGCILATGALAAPVFLVLGASAPPFAWVYLLTPIVAGWVGLALGCIASRRLRVLAAAGEIEPHEATRRMMPFLFAFPAGVAAASGIGLAIADAVGIHGGDMTGLLPYAFAFWSFVIALPLFAWHSIRVGRARP